MPPIQETYAIKPGQGVPGLMADARRWNGVTGFIMEAGLKPGQPVQFAPGSTPGFVAFDGDGVFAGILRDNISAVKADGTFAIYTTVAVSDMGGIYVASSGALDGDVYWDAEAGFNSLGTGIPVPNVSAAAYSVDEGLAILTVRRGPNVAVAPSFRIVIDPSPLIASEPFEARVTVPTGWTLTAFGSPDVTLSPQGGNVWTGTAPASGSVEFDATGTDADGVTVEKSRTVQVAETPVEATLTLSITPTAPRVGDTVTITGVVTGGSASVSEFDDIIVQVDAVGQIVTGSGLTRTVVADRSGTLTVSASAAGVMASISRTVAYAKPVVSLAYSVGSAAAAAVQTTRPGTLYWAISGATAMAAAQIKTGGGAASYGSAVIGVTGGTIAMDALSGSVDLYLHVYLDADGDASNVVRTLVFVPAVVDNPDALATYSFAGGVVNPALTVSRASIGNRLTTAGVYKYAANDVARLHYQPLSGPVLLLEPTLTEGGGTGISPDVVLMGGAEVVSGTVVGRLSKITKTYTMPVAGTDHVRLSSGNGLVPKFVASGTHMPSCITISMRPAATGTGSFIVQYVGNSGMSEAARMSSADGVPGDNFAYVVDLASLTVDVRVSAGGITTALGVSGTVVQNADGWYDIYLFGVHTSNRVGDNYQYYALYSLEDGVSFELEMANARFGAEVASIDDARDLISGPHVPRTTAGGDAGLSVSNALRADFAQETLHISDNLGAVDMRITHLFGLIDLTNQNLDGAWTYAPAVPLRITKIEAYPVGGLPHA